MRESEVERILKREIEKMGGKCFKWVSPGQIGVPDRICILPEGKIIFAEVKVEKGGRVSGMQKYMHKLLTQLGCRVFVLTGQPSVVNMISELRNEQ